MRTTYINQHVFDRKYLINFLLFLMKITANPKRQSTKTAAITATTIRAVLSASPLVPICCSGGFAPECSLLSDEVFLVSPVGFPVRSSGMSDFTADVL